MSGFVPFTSTITNDPIMRTISTILCAVAIGLQTGYAAGTPKKLLVVTTTTGFRHTSIPTLEKVLEQLGKDSGFAAQL